MPLPGAPDAMPAPARAEPARAPGGRRWARPWSLATSPGLAGRVERLDLEGVGVSERAREGQRSAHGALSESPAKRACARCCRAPARCRRRPSRCRRRPGASGPGSGRSLTRSTAAAGSVPSPPAARAAAAVEDVGAERGLTRELGVAQMGQAEDVLDAAQHRVVVVGHLRHRARGDAGRQQHRADVPAAGTVDRRARDCGPGDLAAAGAGVAGGRLVEGDDQQTILAERG